MTRTAKDIKDGLGRAQKRREPYEGLQDWSVKLAYPARQKISDWMNFNDEGQMVGKNIWDGTAFNALETRANGIMAFFMPKTINWFAGQMANRQAREVKSIIKWLQEVMEHLRFTIGRTNYHEMKRLKIMDADSIGCGYMFIDEEVKTGKINCMLPHPREIWIGQDYWGLCNEIYYQFTKTLMEIKNEFGEKALSNSQKNVIKTSPDTKVKIVHAIYKNYEYEETKPPAGKNRKWLSYHVNIDVEDEINGKIIREGGYNTINPIPWQLNKSTHELYGRGTVSQFIIEIMTANYMMRDLLLASQTSVRKPVIALDSLKPYLNLKAGGVTWINRNMMSSLDVRTAVTQAIQNVDYPFGIEMLDKFQTVIESRFGVPFFLMMNRLAEQGGNAYKNVYQIQQMQAERAALMSPFLATLSIQTDMELDRFFDIEFNARRLPQAPPELLQMIDTNIDIEYTGPILQLLKQFYEKSSIFAVIGDIQQLMVIDPQANMNVDWDVMAQKLLLADDAPADAVVPLQNVKEIKQAMAQQAEAQQAAELAAKSAKVIAPMTKNVEEGSLLDNLKKGMAA